MPKELKIFNCFLGFSYATVCSSNFVIRLMQTGRLCVSRAEETEGVAVDAFERVIAKMNSIRASAGL